MRSTMPITNPKPSRENFHESNDLIFFGMNIPGGLKLAQSTYHRLAVIELKSKGAASIRCLWILRKSIGRDKRKPRQAIPLLKRVGKASKSAYTVRSPQSRRFAWNRYGYAVLAPTI